MKEFTETLKEAWDKWFVPAGKIGLTLWGVKILLEWFGVPVWDILTASIGL